MEQFTLKQGDITREVVDVIVNAANSQLMGGGGVDGAIHRAGGPSILAECRKIREQKGACATGQAVMTGAGQLRAKWVVHAVGPIWRGGTHGEAEALRSCYMTSLDLALGAGAKSIAFPSISTGAYGYPIEEAAEIAVVAVRDWLKTHPALEVRFILFTAQDLLVYQRALSVAF